MIYVVTDLYSIQPRPHTYPCKTRNETSKIRHLSVSSVTRILRIETSSLHICRETPSKQSPKTLLFFFSFFTFLHQKRGICKTKVPRLDQQETLTRQVGPSLTPPTRRTRLFNQRAASLTFGCYLKYPLVSALGVQPPISSSSPKTPLSVSVSLSLSALK